ncbi:Polyprenyl synthetase [Malonomonas rubra DSM 5091]|uniref:Polyprenyl synthetase n=1 Tax=Malonomonas rubra DSM 5091 TaxID=1122189 RepID=A0A1M6BVH7_MALRU|nr:polyprenyl synthetase family protein [Malonomonas rubra]SHI52681.1 Polyprenyl synthetase [Malonomonas rubra DSM 5091]
MKENALSVLRHCEPWQRAYQLQQKTVGHFYQSCSELLDMSCAIEPLPEEYFSMERNLFSTLFLLALEASGVASEKMPFYAMVNQCLRVQVTGCDNLLDDEYKSVIPFSMAGEGIRFRSVLTIMTGDAVLAMLAADEVASGRFDAQAAKCLLSAVLAVLIPSGIEEHEEERRGERVMLSVEQMLKEIHYRKTGLLFEAPVRLAAKMRDVDSQRAEQVAKALSTFGIGCQILDDLKDIADDLYFNKHNLVVSVAHYGASEAERDSISAFVEKRGSLEDARLLANQLPAAKKRCWELAVDYFQRAQHDFSRLMPAFGDVQAAALGILVQGAIMAERNELALRSFS